MSGDDHAARCVSKFETFALTSLLLVLCGAIGSAAPPLATNRSLTAALRADLQTYLVKRAAPEHISAVSLAISVPGKPTLALAVGRFTTSPHSAPVDTSSLFQIGSNTKAFTAAIILNLEAQHKLSISDTVGKWLPQYPAWKNITIRRLLNMTSGIPTYDNDPAFQRRWAADPYHHYTPAEFVASVYPKNGRRAASPRLVLLKHRLHLI